MHTRCSLLCAVCFRSDLNALLCSGESHSAGAEYSLGMDNGPVPLPDQLGSKARLMTVVNCGL